MGTFGRTEYLTGNAAERRAISDCDHVDREAYSHPSSSSCPSGLKAVGLIPDCLPSTCACSVFKSGSAKLPLPRLCDLLAINEWMRCDPLYPLKQRKDCYYLYTLDDAAWSSERPGCRPQFLKLGFMLDGVL